MAEGKYKKIVLEKIPITVSQTLSKHTHLTKDIEEEDLKLCFIREHWDLISLLKVLKEYVINDLGKRTSKRTTRQLEAILLSCDNWIEDDFEVIKE